MGRAHESYINCTSSLQEAPALPEKECVFNWFDFQNCSSRLDDLKEELSITLQEQSNIEEKISHIFE